VIESTNRAAFDAEVNNAAARKCTGLLKLKGKKRETQLVSYKNMGEKKEGGGFFPFSFFFFLN
jgi:hypothetical protein